MTGLRDNEIYEVIVIMTAIHMLKIVDSLKRDTFPFQDDEKLGRLISVSIAENH